MTLSRREFLGTVGLGAASLAHAQSQSADLVLYNGKVVTVDSAFSIRQAIAVKDGKVLAVGGNEIRNQFAAARAINLRGRMLMPGFF
jgi:predicted amidohydrolase YtcJ